MTTTDLPARGDMLRAFLERDPAYEGIFVTAVITTGIFCRPTCGARKPKPEHVEFHRDARSALHAGFRPCRRCHPLRPLGEPPDWLEPLLTAVEDDPGRRWRDRDLRALGLSPERVRRWFRRHHGMTFHAYSRARRLGLAFSTIGDGTRVGRVAVDVGFDSLSGFNDAFRRLAGAPPQAVEGAPLLRATRLTTALGPMVAIAAADAVLLLEFADRRGMPGQLRRLRERTGGIVAPGASPLFDILQTQLDEYFAGARAAFDVPIRTPGTPFQREVWRALRDIPSGHTTSYGELARRLGRPAAVRAVARANGANRLAILVPCHRVVGADGSLTGYGGGLWRKRRLLALEGAGSVAAAAGAAEPDAR